MFDRRAVALVAVLCSAAALVHAEQKKAKNDDERFSQPLPDWIQPFENHTRALFKDITAGDGKGVAFDWLAEVADTFGHRHLGSAALEAAIDFNVKRLKADGFDNVHTEDVHGLPHWERGDDLAELIEPRRHKLNILAVDGSPSADITAEAVVVKSFDELKSKAKSGKVRGKIVVFLEKWAGYGNTVKYRRSAADVAKVGAIGVLIKSVGPFSLYSPHTGSGARGSTIPAACITTEEAEMMYRMQERGNKLVIHMNFTSREVGTVTSRNTIFEITGSEKPKEIVLLSGHFDSWDVGQGALDDGGGCAAMWHALLSLKKLGIRPKRTVRVVLWTAEEQGLLGAEGYHKAHNGSDETFFFVSESDQGAFRPKTWNSFLVFSGSTEQMKIFDEIVLLINSFGVPLSVMFVPDQGDVSFWANEGVPAANYITEQGRDYYFYYHHTNADYMTIFKDGDLEYTSAIFATLAHVIANMDSWVSKKRFVTAVSHPEIKGPLSEDFRVWLRNNGFDEEKLTRGDLGESGSYGGRTYLGEKVVNRPIIFIHGGGGIALETTWGYNSHIEYLISRGYSPAELYATTYGNADYLTFTSTTHSCAFVRQLRMFFMAVRQYTGSQVDIIAHSIGVTMARKAILGGFMKEYEGSDCEIGEPLESIHTFIGISGINYGDCICYNYPWFNCNKVTGAWPGTCADNDDCHNPKTDCSVQDYSQFLKDLNHRQKTHRLAEKIVSMYSKNDTSVPYNVWGRPTSVIPGSDVIKVYSNLSHESMRSGTIAYQLEQIVAKPEIQGPISKHFRDWLQKNGYDVSKFTRSDFGRAGSYGGRRMPTEKIAHRPVIFVHGIAGIALETIAPKREGFTGHIEFLINKGYSPAELYATTYGDASLAQWNDMAHTCEYVRHIREFILAVKEYTGAPVDIIAHSLGVTIARKAILGGSLLEVTGNTCEIGDALDSIDTFIAIAGANYGQCNCVKADNIKCNPVNGLWPGNCSHSSGNECERDICVVESRSRLLDELNRMQKSHRLARKIVSLHSEDDNVVYHKVWGTATSIVQNSSISKVYQGLDHVQVKTETILDQYEQLIPSDLSDLSHKSMQRNIIADQPEQMVARPEIQGPLSKDFRDWLQKHDYDESKFTRSDLGSVGSYGGRRMPTEKIVHRPVIFVHGNAGIALSTSIPKRLGFRKNIEFLVKKGYSPAELYATTYGTANVAQYSENTHSCEFVRHIREFIMAVQEYTGSPVDIIAHSLGVTIARKAILGGSLLEFTGNTCQIGDALGSIDTFIGLGGANYGVCDCSKGYFSDKINCNPVNGLWPGNCSNSGGNDCERDICVVESRSRLLDELNRLQKSHRLARKIVSFYSEDDEIVDHKVWGTTTSIVPNSSVSKVYQGLDHDQVKSETLPDQFEQLNPSDLSDLKTNAVAGQLEQMVAKPEIQGPLSKDFRDWLQKHKYDESKFTRSDFGSAGSYGGRRMPTEKIIHRPVIFVHGVVGIALSTTIPKRSGFNQHIEFLINKGYSPAELYATTYGTADDARYSEYTHSCEFVRHIREFIMAVQEYTGSPVDIIAHSLGVTIARKAILGGSLLEFTGDICEIGDALDSIDTFIGTAGSNYGHCQCSKNNTLLCNPMNGFWPGNCSHRNSNDCERDICVVENRSRMLDELNSLQKSHRLARNIVSFYSEDDATVHHTVWGTVTSVVPNSSVIKVYHGLDHDQVKSETLPDQYEQLVA